VFIAWATLTPAPDPNGLTLLTPTWCLVCGDQGGADIVVNLLLFLPFAIGLRLAGVSWRRTVIVSATLSFTVELLQALAIPGRDPSLSDLLTNTTSGAIGAALGVHLPAAVRPSRAHAARLLAGGAMVWLAALGLAAWLLTPFMPDGMLLSYWAHEAPGFDVFAGRVDAIRLDGLAMPKNGVPSDTAAVRHRLEQGHASLDADVTSGAANHYTVWIYRLQVPSGRALTLYELGHAVGLAVPVRGLQFLAAPVTVTLPDGLPGRPGIPVRLHATWRDGIVRLSSTYEGVTRTVELGISPAYGWRLVSPFELGTGTTVRWFTGLCLGLSVLPLAYWASRMGLPGAGLLASTIVAGLAGVPWLAGLAPVHWSEWLAAGLGAAAGWALQPAAAYLERRCASPSASEYSSS
jgi:VanZ like protein